MTLQQGRQSMHLAAVVVLVVDCSHLVPHSSAEAPAGLSTPVSDGLGGSLPAALTRREVALAHDTWQEGRVLVVAANKLDVVPLELRKQVGPHRAVAAASARPSSDSTRLLAPHSMRSMPWQRHPVEFIEVQRTLADCTLVLKHT